MRGGHKAKRSMTFLLEPSSEKLRFPSVWALDRVGKRATRGS